MSALPPEAVQLVVTSPPYPMIEMWDESFASQDPAIGAALREGDGWSAFRLMHEILDRAWREVRRVLVGGGIACINIGDATRTVRKSFALYPNHARILSCFLDLGFTPLPAIVWRKQTNAPNKFMGSGMLPPGAYVTLEHEYVLILRKGDKRPLESEEAKVNRRASSFFWEERNNWYSDVWFDLKGARQNLFDDEARDRSGAFPFELPDRLISMFSVKGDTVLDPFLGAGTTTFAAMATCRNSVGYEVDPGLGPVISGGAGRVVPLANARIDERLEDHADFVRARHEAKGKGSLRHRNQHYGFPVMTRQETELLLNRPVTIEASGRAAFRAEYLDEPPAKDLRDWGWFYESGGKEADAPPVKKPRKARKTSKAREPGKTEKTENSGGERTVQLDLFDLPDGRRDQSP